MGPQWPRCILAQLPTFRGSRIPLGKFILREGKLDYHLPLPVILRKCSNVFKIYDKMYSKDLRSTKLTLKQKEQKPATAGKNSGGNCSPPSLHTQLQNEPGVSKRASKLATGLTASLTTAKPCSWDCQSKAHPAVCSGDISLEGGFSKAEENREAHAGNGICSPQRPSLWQHCYFCETL